MPTIDEQLVRQLLLRVLLPQLLGARLVLASLMPMTAPMPYMSENMPSKPLLYVTGRFVGGAPAARTASSCSRAC